MFEQLNAFDHHLFLTIHQFRSSSLDFMMPLITNRWFWIPLYALLLFLLWKRFGKETIRIAITIAVLILLSDQTANLLKNSIQRPRPCYDSALAGQVITLNGCGGNFGFVSGHATNSMAIAVFLWLLIRNKTGKTVNAWAWLFPWSILICWSRIYMGVHFPFDLIGGCLLGAICAFLCFFLYRKYLQTPAKA
jgi:undecaprenyl-diphosphatase